ncbi:MAG: pilus assembly protein PilM [Phycisphaerae bacterium]
MLMDTLTRTRRSAIALDVGCTGVRAVQLQHRGQQWSTIHSSRVEARAASRDPADVPEQTDVGLAAKWGRWIEACVARAEFQGKQVSVVISPPDVEFHTLELPENVLVAVAEDVSAIVRGEMQRLIPDAAHLDSAAYWRLPPTSMSAPNLVSCATPSGLLEDVMRACRSAHLDCVTVDTSATALCRFGNLLCGFDDNTIWGILDVGYRQTRLVLCLGSVPILVRCAGGGGQSWTRQIAENLGISAKAAEVHKCSHGILPPSDRTSGAAPADERNGLGAMLFGVLRNELIPITAEIKRSYEYALSCYARRRPADLMVVGGGAALRHLPDFLSDELGIPVRPASTYLGGPDCRLGFPHSAASSLEVYALAIGLAMEE